MIMMYDSNTIEKFLGLKFDHSTYRTNQVIWQAIDITFPFRGYGQPEGIGILSFPPVGIVLKTNIYYKDLEYLGVRNTEYDSSIFRLRDWWNLDWY